MTQKKHSLLILVFLFLALCCWGDETASGDWYRYFSGFKYLKNYPPNTYNSANQNWAILQDARGILYFGNQDRLLLFDGVSWSYISVPNNTVRSLAQDSNGTIYVGGMNEMGYLAPNSSGVLEYISLLPHLEEKYRVFSYVFQTHCSAQGVWFKTADKLYRWYQGKFKVWDMAGSKNTFRTVFSWKGHCYVQQRYVGLMEVVGDSFGPLRTIELFREEKIITALPFNDDTLLLGTSEKGCYLYDGTTTRPFPTEADTYLQENKLSCCIRLTNGDWAAGTQNGGLVILAPGGQLKAIFTRENSGLADDNVRDLFEDGDGSLWLCLNDGIARIDYASPFFFFDQNQGLRGLTLSVTRHNNKLYVGTTAGLYVFEPKLPGQPSRFHPVPDISGNVWDLLPFDDSVLVAAAKAVLRVGEGETVTEVLPNTVPFVLSLSPSIPGRVWMATDNSLFALQYENKDWHNEFKVESIQPGIRSIVEDRTGNVWLGTKTSSVVKVEFGNPQGTQQSRVLHYDETHRLPKGENFVTQIADHIVFATSLGLYRFDITSNGFLPDATLGKNFCDGSRNIFRLKHEQNGRIWFHSDFENFYAPSDQGGVFKVHPLVFPLMSETQVNMIYPDQEKIWFACSDGLVCYDSNVSQPSRSSFCAIIRQVTFKDGGIFYGGFNPHPATISPVPLIEYKNRHLRFHVAAPFFLGSGTVSFRYLMDGFDDNWSAWTNTPTIGYTNLDFGTYTFHVQAKDVYGVLGREDTFSFTVLSPWYFTWWAYCVYAFVALGLIYLLVRWRSAQLVKETRRLEQVVADRTREINSANIQLQLKTQLLEEQSEQLKEMDNAKSRFFANISHEFRTPLSLIMGPLDHLRGQTSDPAAIKQMDLAYRNAQRLLGLINQLLDLAKLESGKMKLQAEPRDLPVFLKALLEAFLLAAQRQQVELLFSSSRDSIPIYFDVEKMEKIMLNLLSNALKFTPPGGRITVSVSEASPYVDIAVADTGPGIPPDQLEFIFDRFYQGTTTREHRLKGSGIGLSLTRELVELHQGEISVSSSTSGSIFTVRLPLGSAHLVPTERMDTGTAGSTGIIGDRPEFALTEALRLATSSPSQLETVADDTDIESITVGEEPQPQGKDNKDIILVVEDNQDLRDYIRSSLGPTYRVEEAKDGHEGIEKAKSIVPDLIISDIMMPEVDGYELLRAVKSDIATSHIPVVMLTAKTSEASILQGLETGADDYITKPFNTRVLCARVKNLIELRRQLQQNLNREMVMQPSQVHISKIDCEFLAEVQRVIEKNLSEPEFNVEDMSRRLDMSRTTLYRKILALCGETPTDYIRSYRLKRAAQLFKKNFGSVTEVAFEVGFTSRAYFTKCFKEKFHRLPSEFPASFDAAGRQHFS